MKINWTQIAIAGLNIILTKLFSKKSKSERKVKIESKVIDLKYNEGEFVDGVLYVTTDNDMVYQALTILIRKTNLNKLKVNFTTDKEFGEDAVYTCAFQYGQRQIGVRTFVSVNETLINELKERVKALV